MGSPPSLTAERKARAALAPLRGGPELDAVARALLVSLAGPELERGDELRCGDNPGVHAQHCSDGRTPSEGKSRHPQHSNSNLPPAAQSALCFMSNSPAGGISAYFISTTTCHTVRKKVP